MSSGRAATSSAAHPVPSNAGPSPRAAGAPFHVGRGRPGQSALPPPPKGSLAHAPHFGHRADSPRVYFAAPAVLCHRPCRMIAESGRRPGPSAGPTPPGAMAGEPLAQARRLRRRLDSAVDRLGRHHEDGRTGIAVVFADLPELVQGGHGPAGDEHHLALAGLIGLAPLDEQPAGAVVPPFGGGPNESGASSATPVPRDAGAAITVKSV